MEITRDYKFTPSQELLDFSEYFSENWKTLECGDYSSDDMRYHINYPDRIIDEKTSEEVKTNVRVGHDSKIIQFSKHFLNKFESDNDYVFFLILWCIVKVDLSLKSDINADLITIEHYLTTGRPINPVIKGCENMFSYVNISSNRDRMKSIMDYIEAHDIKR